MKLPEFIELETSRYCNRRCPWCPNGLSAERTVQDLMPWELFTDIVEQFAVLSFDGWIALHNYNEPLANARLFDELKVVADELPRSKPSIFTNGDLLTADLVNALADVGVRYLRVTRYPKHSQYAAGPNENSLKRWLRQSKLDQAARWNFGPVRQGFAATGTIRGLTLEAISPNIATYNFRGGTTETFLSKKRTSPCAFTTHSAAIDYKGQLKMCCNVYPEDVRHADYIVGSLAKDSFTSLWESKKMVEYRHAHSSADWSQSSICGQCAHFLTFQGSPAPSKDANNG